MYVTEHSRQERDAVTGGEASDIDGDVSQAVKEEDHAEEKQQVIVTGDHVLGAEVQERPDVRAGHGFQEVGITPGDGVSQAQLARGKQNEKYAR